MVVVLDTNHIREFSLATSLGQQLRKRLSEAKADVMTTVVCAEEIQRGWLSQISQARGPDKEVWAYKQLGESIQFLASIPMLPWDLEAAARFLSLRQTGLRIGSMDLKIACITLEHDATLLTRNTLDFSKVPGLRIENWVD